MSKHDKIGAIILGVWVVFWLCFFGYLIAVMPDYGTGVLH